MKEIVCVAGYPNTKEKTDMVKNMLSVVSVDTCITSHYPVPASCYKLATYYIYDSNNKLVPYSLPMHYAHRDLKLTYELDTQYNGWACYTELYNAIKLFGKTYDILHFVEADNNPEALVNHIEQVRKLDRSDWRIAGYPFYGEVNQDPPCGLVTNLFSINLKRIGIMPIFKDWDEIVDFMCGGDPYFEILLKRIFDGQVRYLDDTNVIQTNKARNINILHSFISDWTDQYCMLFIVSVGDYDSEQTFNIDGINITAGVPGHGFYWKILDKTSTYNGQKITMNNKNRFRFTNGRASPYWDEKDDKKVALAYYGADNG